MKKLILLTLLLCFAVKAESQTNLNNYKYVVIPLQYDFLKGKDTYKLSTLTRVLFKEEGFKAYYTDEQLPDELFLDRCSAIYTDLKKIKGFFRTKIQIIISDCNGKILFESEIGDSKENNYQKAHNMALRNAFKSIERLNYNYDPLSKEEKQPVEETEKKLEIEVEEVLDVQEVVEVEEEVVSSDLIKKQMPNTTIIEKPELDNSTLVTDANNLLNARVIENGFQLIKSDNTVLMILLDTAAINVFIVKGKDAIVFKQNGKWVYSENNGDSVKTENLEIKF